MATKELKKMTKEQLIREVVSLHAQLQHTPKELTICTYATNQNTTLGLGSMDLKGGNLVTCRYRREYLEQALKVLKCTGVEFVDILYKEGFPIMFGNMNSHKTKASGVFVAPVGVEDGHK